MHGHLFSTIYTKVILCEKKTHELAFRQNYFTPLTLFCDAFAKGATPVYVAPMGAAPHIVG
jgi:hypothetical protein